MNKLTKLLSVFVIAGALGAGIAGVTACNKGGNGGGGGGGETPTHEYTYTQNSDQKTHNGVCKVDGCTEHSPITNEACVDEKNNETQAAGKDGKCDKCGQTIKTESGGEGEKEYEDVTTKFDFEAAYNGNKASIGSDGKLTEAVTVGKFTFAKGAKLESTQVNTQGKDITIVLAGTENSISFNGKGASKDAAITYTLTKNGQDVTPTTWETTVNNEAKDFSVTKLEAGTYVLSTSKSSKITNLTIVEKLEKSEATGITVSGGKRSFLIGTDLSTAGINVTLNYANGRKDVLTSGDFTVTDDYDKTVAGTYTVTVTYGKNSLFKDTYKVTVVGVDSIVLGDHSLSAARETLPVQTIFAKGGQFNTENLGIKLVCGNDNFYVKPTDSNIAISSVDTSTVGAKQVTVSGYTKTSEPYTVYVLDFSGVNKEQVTVKVDGTATPAVNGNTVTVKSVNQAIQVYKLLEVGENATKEIKIAAGSYKEKISIDIPNVKLIGEGTAASDVVLWYDGINGHLDPSGSLTYSTNGSASVTVTADADGFYAENLEIKNYYNTNELYNQSLQLPDLDKSDGGGSQAVAMLIDADKAVFKNVRFSGFHDTLYDRSGRHVYEDCYIEGCTDYIFGYDAVSYFKNCTIKSLAKGSNGGYLACTKGSAGQLYGYVFDGCTITSDSTDSGVVAALGRAWDTNMTAAFINCKISDRFPAGAGRYVSMNANSPIKSTLIFEFGNTNLDGSAANMGESSVCTILADASAAAEFTDMAKIFAKVQKRTGASDFTTTYSDDWDGTAGTTVTTIKYDLMGYTGGQLQGTTGEYLDIKIDATNGKFNLRLADGDVQINAGTILYIPVAEQYAIIIERKGTVLAQSDYYNIEYVQYEGSLHAKITWTTSYYASVILVDKAQTVDIVSVTFNYNDDGATQNSIATVVKDGKVKKPSDPTWTGKVFEYWYTTDENTEYDFNTPVTGNLTLTAKWRDASAEEQSPIISQDTTISFGNEGTYKSLSANGKVVFTGGTPRDNGTNCEMTGITTTIKVKAGAVITITAFSQEKYNNYDVKINGTLSEANTAIHEVERVITVSANDDQQEYATVELIGYTKENSSNNGHYFTSIVITYPAA